MLLLTESLQQPLRFVLPTYTKQVDRNACGDDAKADGALHWSLPEGDHDEEQTRHYETHWQQNVHLRGDGCE